MDAHIVTPKMGRKEKFVLNKGVDNGRSDGNSSFRKANVAVPVDDSSLDEEDVNHWTSERIMRWIIVFLSVLVLLLTAVIIILVAEKSSESKEGTVSASRGVVPPTTTTTTKPTVVMVQQTEDEDYDSESHGRRRGHLPPGFIPAVTEETIRFEPDYTTADFTTLEASGDLPGSRVDASGEASGSGDSPVTDGRTTSRKTPQVEDLLPVSNSRTTLDTWTRFLTFQDDNSGRTTRKAPPAAQPPEYHDYSADYSQGDKDESP